MKKCGFAIIAAFLCIILVASLAIYFYMRLPENGIPITENGCDGTFGGLSGGGHQCVLKPGMYDTLLAL